MDKEKIKTSKRKKRQIKIRSKIKGTHERPRLTVFKSNKGHFVQLIDDDKGFTLVSAHSREAVSIKEKNDNAEKTGAKIASAYELGKLIAKKAAEKKITEVVFDRSGYKYHGRIKALAEGAREGGLKF